MNITELLKETRAEAKRQGMTLRTYKRLTINGQKAYYLVKRRTGEDVIENCTLDIAYENLLSGDAAEFLKRV